MSGFELDREVDGVVSMSIIDKQRNQLIELIDNSENGWLIFMDKIGQFLGPIASKAGRPTKDEIKATMLGPLGFSTWREMIEAERKNNGLGWNFSTYQAWRKAYSIISKVDGLRNEKLTPTEINRLGAKLKSSNDGKLPESMVEWSNGLDDIEIAKAKAKADSEIELKKDLAEARKTLSKRISDLDKQSIILDGERRLNKNLEAQIVELNKQLTVQNENVQELTKNIASKDSEIIKITRKHDDSITKVSMLNKDLSANRLKLTTLTNQVKTLKDRSIWDIIFKKS